MQAGAHNHCAKRLRLLGAITTDLSTQQRDSKHRSRPIMVQRILETRTRAATFAKTFKESQETAEKRDHGGPRLSVLFSGFF